MLVKQMENIKFSVQRNHKEDHYICIPQCTSLATFRIFLWCSLIQVIPPRHSMPPFRFNILSVGLRPGLILFVGLGSDFFHLCSYFGVMKIEASTLCAQVYSQPISVSHSMAVFLDRLMGSLFFVYDALKFNI